ncbi:MAG: hypothetical protein JWM76_1054 [Pseudonocardiales bacterium]|nr:hypothetical protein [Pseudonocardiales bacterium]
MGGAFTAGRPNLSTDLAQLVAQFCKCSVWLCSSFAESRVLLKARSVTEPVAFDVFS